MWYRRGCMRERAIGLVKLGLALVATWAVTTAAIKVANRRPTTTDLPSVRFPLGDTLPYVELRTPDGVPISLRQRLGGKPTLLYVFGTRECAGCSNLPLEFEIVRRENPG